MSSDINMNGYGVRNLRTPTLAGDAVTKAYADSITSVVDAGDLTGTTLAANVVNSSLTTLGVQSEILDMGTNNISNAGTVTATGANIGSVTISGTSISTATGAGHLNISKNLDMNANNIINAGNINGFALPSSNFVGTTDTQTLTNKTLTSCASINTLAIPSSDFVGRTDAQTLTNKTLTSCASINGLALPISAFVGISDSQTLSNKSLNLCASINSLSIPTTNFVGQSDTQTISNKTLTSCTINGSQLVDGSVTAAKLASGTGSATDFMFRTKDATQVYSSAGVTVAISFPTANSSNGITYTASGSDFYVTIAKTGKYIVQWAFTWNYSAAQNLISHYITVNNGTNRYGYVQHGSGSSNDHAGGSCAVMNLVAGDVLRFLYSHNIAANIVNNAANVFEWGYLGIVQVQ